MDDKQLAINVMNRLAEVETMVRRSFERLEQSVAPLRVIGDGLEAYRARCVDTAKPSFDPIARWQSRIRADRSLRFPHRKILDVLLESYDFAERRFEPIRFTRLVKLAKVGKGRAGGYLDALEHRHYVTQTRTAGQRLVGLREDEGTGHPDEMSSRRAGRGS